MIRSLLSSIGIGGASVDTLLESTDVVVGEQLRGEVRIRGGAVEQDVRGVVLELVTRCLVEAAGDQKVHADVVLASGTVAPGRVGAGQTKSLPIRIDVPASAPLSVGSTSTLLRTRLDIAEAIDPRDSDRVRLAPNRAMAAVFEGMEATGFRLAETEVEYDPRRANPFVQEFDFRPRSLGDFGIGEVEISFVPVRGGVQVLLTVDNRGGFFNMGRERSARFQVLDAELGRLNMAAELRAAIQSLR